MRPFPNRVRALREARALSQAALAERVTLSRQSLSAIEAGRAIPGVDVALRIARTLECPLETLFGADAPNAVLDCENESRSPRGRAAMARIDDRWLCYPLTHDALRTSADGVVTAPGARSSQLEPLRPLDDIAENVILMGCALGLGLVSDRLNRRRGAGRFVWLPRSSASALQALARRRTHLAGVHLVDTRTGEANVADVQRAGSSEATVLITLARWRAGLVMRRDSARIEGVSDLAAPGLRVVRRETGAGAQRLLESELRKHGLAVGIARKAHLEVSGHLEVARAIALGAADVGVATYDAAQAFDLEFVTLAEERYDLALARSSLDDARIQRWLDALCSSEVRRELTAIGYDATAAGTRVAEVRAA